MHKRKPPLFDPLDTVQLRQVVESAVEAQTTPPEQLPAIKYYREVENTPLWDLNREIPLAREGLFAKRLNESGIPKKGPLRGKAEEMYERLKEEPGALISDVRGAGVVLPESVLESVKELPGYWATLRHATPTHTYKNVLDTHSITFQTHERQSDGTYKPVDDEVELTPGALLQGLDVSKPDTPQSNAKLLGTFELEDGALLFRVPAGMKYSLVSESINPDDKSVYSTTDKTEDGRFMVLDHTDEGKRVLSTLKTEDLVRQPGPGRNLVVGSKYRIEIEANPKER